MRRLLAVALFLFSAQAGASCPLPDVRLALHDFPPFYYPGPNGQPQGELVELFSRAMARLGCNWSSTFYPVPRLLSSVAEGGSDAAMIIRHPLLEGRSHYGSVPVGALSLKLFHQPGLPDITSIEQIPAGSRVIIRRGYGYHGYVDQLLRPDSGIIPVLANTHEQAVSLLQQGRGDYLLNYAGPSQHYLNLKGLYHISGAEIASWPIYLVLSEHIKRGEEFITAFEASLTDQAKAPQ